MKNVLYVGHGRSEAEIQRAIVFYLRSIGAFVAITDPGTLRKHGVHKRHTGIPLGWPDLVAAMPNGVTLYIECKSAKGRLSKYQQAARDVLLKLGHRYILARTMEDVIDAIEEPTDG